MCSLRQPNQAAVLSEAAIRITVFHLLSTVEFIRRIERQGTERRTDQTMARHKRWYDPEASEAVRVVSRSAGEPSYASLRWRPPRMMPGLLECNLYPLSDGPGL